VFSSDFYKNKQMAEELLTFPTSKLRNKVAGYLTRIHNTTINRRARERRE